MNDWMNEWIFQKENLFLGILWIPIPSLSDPLHPKLSPLDILGRELADEFRRSEEIMTLTIWGQRVGGLIGAVDDFLLNIVAQLAERINEENVQ